MICRRDNWRRVMCRPNRAEKYIACAWIDVPCAVYGVECKCRDGASSIVVLGIMWREVVTSHPRKSPNCPLYKRMGGSPSRSEVWGREKDPLLLTEIEPRYLGSPTHSSVTTLTNSSRPESVATQIQLTKYALQYSQYGRLSENRYWFQRSKMTTDRQTNKVISYLFTQEGSCFVQTICKL
jgi:hypothetical protein